MKWSLLWTAVAGVPSQKLLVTLVLAIVPGRSVQLQSKDPVTVGALHVLPSERVNE